MLLGVGAALFVSWQDIVGAIGSWIFIGTVIVLVAGLISGYLAGFGRSKSDMTVIGFATAQRNISAALVVAGSLGGNVIVLTLVGALVIPIALIILAAELGKRIAASSSGSAADLGSGAADRRCRWRFIGVPWRGSIASMTATLALMNGVPCNGDRGA